MLYLQPGNNFIALLSFAYKDFTDIVESDQNSHLQCMGLAEINKTPNQPIWIKVYLNVTIYYEGAKIFLLRFMSNNLS